jgi:hypothetical protein
MPVRRLRTIIATSLAVACTVSVAGVAAAAPAAAPSVAEPAVAAASVPGQPSDNYTMLPGNYFSFPNRSATEKYAIRNRVLRTINSTWGGKHNGLGEPSAPNGSIKITTWSFNDWSIAKALVRARNRGVTVQIMAATTRNVDNPQWQYLRRQLGATLYKPGHRETAPKHSWARQCRGSCRGSGGTPHSKFFLFNNVGSGHNENIVMQTSANLTSMAYQGQWNQSQVVWSEPVYRHFSEIFTQMGWGRPASVPYRAWSSPTINDYFFPKPGTTGSTDPVMAALNKVNCTGATAGGTGSRTKIRIIQYAIYDNRGVWLAKRLRYLWNRGCDVAIIYSISTRPVIAILRSHSGRGPIPMKQSVITNSKGEIVKYNHSKWMTISGNWNGHTNSYMAFSGSANWSNAAFANDEQMQQIISPYRVTKFLQNFLITWRQKSSHAPGYGQKMAEGRVMANAYAGTGGGYAPGSTIPWGTGAYKHLDPNGE